MECPRCRRDTPPDADFCPECGTRLVVVCGQCRTANAPGHSFCKRCGTPLAPARGAGGESPVPPESYTPRYLAERILTSRGALEGERKQVTVLFADLRGSMELLAERDPEEARRLLDPLLERMMEAVHRYEGTVNQVMGDGIMALFGAPLAHEDHAVRACYAALRMQEAVTRYGDEIQRSQGVPIQIRVGLNSGDVVVRAIGSDLHMDYTAVGQTTHLAARMEQMAKPGSALATGETLRLAEGYVRARPLGPMRVKGLAEPVEAFELLGPGPVRTRLEAASARGFTRFVGRQAELTALRSALERARVGHGQVAGVLGEPGVGKTRLLHEFTRSPGVAGWRVLEASCASYGKGSPFLPVAGLLRGYLQIDDGDEARTIREKLAEKLLTLDPALQVALPAFLALMDVPVEDPGWEDLDPGTRRDRTLEECRRLLLHASRVQPLVLVFEDLHWADPDTVALLDGLVDGLATARILLVASYRPEYRHGWGSKSYYTQIRVDPLPAETAGDLLRTLLGDDPSLGSLKGVLVDRTDGNPFFLEECVRTLVETGDLAGAPGAYRLVRAVPAVQVPDTVQALLAARIDRLPPEEKHLLQSASVVGRDVPLALLQAIAEVPEEGLRRGLARLQAAELLYETALFPEVEYTFRHGLTHEVAYGSLLQARRRALHARIVQAFETLYPGRVAERADWLAHHAFRGEVWGRALGYLRRVTADPSRPGVDDALGGPQSAGYLWWTGEHERAVTIAQRDLAVGADFGNAPLALAGNFHLGQAYHALGDYRRAADHLRRNVESLDGDLAREDFGMAGLPSVFSRSWLGLALAEQGELVEGLRLAEDGVQIADAADHAFSQVVAHFGLGGLYLVRDDPGRAAAVLERGLVIARMAGLALLLPFAAAPLGYAYALTGRGAEATPLLGEALDRGAALGLEAHRSIRVAWLGEAHHLAGRRGQAARLARQALAFARERRERGHEAYALRLLGEVAAGGDPPETVEAEAAYREALALAVDLGMRPLAARCRLGLGALYGRAGRPADARAELRAAVDLLRALALADWAARAAAELGNA